MNVVRYDHHGVNVAVRADLKGRHREYCLCYQCAKFTPANLDTNCPIAQALYQLDVLAHITTPVWECAAFERAQPAE